MASRPTSGPRTKSEGAIGSGGTAQRENYRDFDFDVRRHGRVAGLSTGASAVASGRAASPLSDSVDGLPSPVSDLGEAEANGRLSSEVEEEVAVGGLSTGEDGAGVDTTGAGGADGCEVEAVAFAGSVTAAAGACDEVEEGARAGIGTNSPGRHVWGIRRIEGSFRNRSA